MLRKQEVLTLAGKINHIELPGDFKFQIITFIKNEAPHILVFYENTKICDSPFDMGDELVIGRQNSSYEFLSITLRNKKTQESYELSQIAAPEEKVKLISREHVVISPKEKIYLSITDNSVNYTMYKKREEINQDQRIYLKHKDKKYVIRIYRNELELREIGGSNTKYTINERVKITNANEFIYFSKLDNGYILTIDGDLSIHGENDFFAS
jgi:hypothetical protein